MQHWIWLTTLMLIVKEYACTEEVVVFAGDKYSRTFTEPRIASTSVQSVTTSTISIYLGSTALSTAHSSSLTNGGWYVKDFSNSSTSNISLQNDDIVYKKANFVIKVTFSSRAIKYVIFTVLNAQVTRDFTLPSNPEAESFTLTCTYNSDNVSDALRLKEMFWAIQTRDDNYSKNFVRLTNTNTGFYVHSTSYEHNQTESSATNTEHTIQLTISKLGKEKRNVGITTPNMAAYSGVYGCHMIVYSADSVPSLPAHTDQSPSLHSTYLVTVSAKPTLYVYQESPQFLSGDTVNILCIVDSYPQSSLTWTFINRKKSQPPPTSSNIAGATPVDVIAGKKYIITESTLIGIDNFNSRKKSLLVIHDVRNTLDRGIYQCSASSLLGSAQDSYYLRVRYRYAYVVPLGGIVVQVIILVCSVRFCRSVQDGAFTKTDKAFTQQRFSSS